MYKLFYLVFISAILVSCAKNRTVLRPVYISDLGNSVKQTKAAVSLLNTNRPPSLETINILNSNLFLASFLLDKTVTEMDVMLKENKDLNQRLFKLQDSNESIKKSRSYWFWFSLTCLGIILGLVAIKLYL